MLQSDCSLRLSRISLLSGFQKQGDQLFAGKTCEIDGHGALENSVAMA